MHYFPIESAAEKIVDSRTRSYFDEVLRTYINGNLRSATVMLWSVVVCDLIYKLQQAAELFNDEVADSILKKVKAMQDENPRSPDWEITLVGEVNKRTHLLSI